MEDEDQVMPLALKVKVLVPEFNKIVIQFWFP